MRIKNASINSAFAIIQRIVESVLAFIYRTIFIQTIGVTYLGVNGLFTNIFSVFSLMELGVGSSIIFLIYEPLAKNDNEKIKTYMKFYSNMYKLIGISIFIIGITIIPFLPYIINNETEIPDIIPIYILTLLNTVVSYFFAYKRSLLEADQKAYYNSINYSIFNVISTIIRTIILLTTKNYLATLVIFIIITLLSNLEISLRTNKMYPYLKEKNVKKLEKNQKKEITKRMKATMMHHVGNILITSTDNIIISSLISIIIVGIYSNYSMITNLLYSTISLIFVSITASVGNLKVTETEEKSEQVYNRMFFINYFFYYIICVILWCVFNNFITVWIGSEFLLSDFAVALIILSLYIRGMRHTPVTFINSSGLNYNTRYKPLAEAAINIIVSIIGAKLWGIEGVILGTILAYSLSVWIEPIILYKYWFKKSSIKYFIKYLTYIVFTILMAIVLERIILLITISGWIGLIIKSIVALAISILAFIICFHRTDEFRYYLEIANMFKDKLVKIIKNKIRKDGDKNERTD